MQLSEKKEKHFAHCRSLGHPRSHSATRYLRVDVSLWREKGNQGSEYLETGFKVADRPIPDIKAVLKHCPIFY